ncbi:MAG: succinylglutamate desuccinylase/aspartoacylase family protein [Pseudomonadota bacterium]
MRGNFDRPLPDLSRYRQASVVAPYTVSYEGKLPGPTVVITAIIHGNEWAGAVALDNLAQQLDHITAGQLHLCFAHHEAYGRYDPIQPLAGRYLQRDMNRLWSDDLMSNGDDSWEAQRARELAPLIDRCDFLLDLHTMVRPGPPLAFIGKASRHRDLAQSVGYPNWIVVDPGHASGQRLTDYKQFREDQFYASALLVECGGHQEASSAVVAERVAWRFLQSLHLVDPPLEAVTLVDKPPQKFVRTTHTLSPSNDNAFSFARPFQGLELLPEMGTLVATDGGNVIRTPYENCVVLMPAILPITDDTALRFARVEDRID